MGKKKKRGERKGKKKRKKTARKQKHTYYEIKGGTVERKKQPCPKCGPGVFMAEHKGRLVCGKCSYTKWI